MKSGITIQAAQLYFIGVDTRMPLKFGPETHAYRLSGDRTLPVGLLRNRITDGTTKRICR